MYIVTSDEMRRLDRYTIETIGIPAVVLMENAGRAVAEEVGMFSCSMKANKPWLILVGKGNNGGDGIVAARHLSEMGISVQLLYAVMPEQLTRDAAFQRDAANHLAIPSLVYTEGNVAWEQYAGIVDALFGTGTKGAPRVPFAPLIREANASGLPIISVDIPSGLDADTGEVHSPCIKADKTVALAFTKRGLVQYPGAEWAGQVVVRPIGIPQWLAERHGIRTYASDRRMLREMLGFKLPIVRGNDSHKGTFGHALIIAGSRKYSGAGMLSAKAALRAGAGLVSWALPDRLLDAAIGKVPEAILCGISDSGTGDWSHTSPKEVLQLAKGKNALAVGPGLDRFAQDTAWIRTLWTESTGPLVLDADALNMIADAADFDRWPKRVHPTILTPHPGEMARLTGVNVREVQRNRIEWARRYATERGVTLVLKGAGSVVATPKGEVFVNATGNAGMATGGTGDVLTGIIAGLLAQGFAATPAAVGGVYLHGDAGDRAAANRPSPASLMAGDLIDML